MYEHRKEFMDIRHDHKNAHFQMGINVRSQSTTTLDRQKPTNHEYGESALAKVAFKQRGISNTYKSSITLGPLVAPWESHTLDAMLQMIKFLKNLILHQI